VTGLDTTKVSKIDSIVITRDPAPRVAPWSLEVAEVSSATINDWFNDFLVAGHHQQQYERSGSLQFLSPDMAKTLLFVTLKQCGITRLAKVASEGTSVAKRKADLYCEQALLPLSARG
jgi:hypothetical protein